MQGRIKALEALTRALWAAREQSPQPAEPEDAADAATAIAVDIVGLPTAAETADNTAEQPHPAKRQKVSPGEPDAEIKPTAANAQLANETGGNTRDAEMSDALPGHATAAEAPAASSASPATQPQHSAQASDGGAASMEATAQADHSNPSNPPPPELQPGTLQPQPEQPAAPAADVDNFLQPAEPLGRSIGGDATTQGQAEMAWVLPSSLRQDSEAAGEEQQQWPQQRLHGAEGHAPGGPHVACACCMRRWHAACLPPGLLARVIAACIAGGVITPIPLLAQGVVHLRALQPLYVESQEAADHAIIAFICNLI